MSCHHFFPCRRLVPLLVFMLLAVAPQVRAAEAEEFPTAEKTLTLGVPISLTESGIMRELAERFRHDTGILVIWASDLPANFPVMGQRCDIDAFISHIPEFEYDFMHKGKGELWLSVLYSNLLLAGPKGNPGKLSTRSLLKAMAGIDAAELPFISCRDGLGTFLAEQFLWSLLRKQEQDIEPWHINAPPQPGAALPLAAEKQAYTLCDAWSWEQFNAKYQPGDCPLEIIVGFDPALVVQYNIITVSPSICPQTNSEAAKRFANWITSPEIQTLIGEFRYNGNALFMPVNDTQ